MVQIDLEYIAAGGNRHPSAADWAPGLLAFGSENNIALWNPEDDSCKGIAALLAGHADIVNVVKILDAVQGRFILSGSADKSIRIWRRSSNQDGFTQSLCLTEHNAAINTISILPGQQLFVSGSADATVKIWTIASQDAKVVQSISLKPHYLPLTSALVDLGGGAVALAVAGTSTSIQIYVRSDTRADFELQATLIGHESWIRSLDFTKSNENEFQDVMLASASQDKYIRLWRFRKHSNSPEQLFQSPVDSLATPRRSLSSKTQQIAAAGKKYVVTFEALLIGHEDWIYTARWAPRHDRPSGLKLLSASADNSLAIWQMDEMSGVWICNTRLGEISAQKGSTTATGSTGGFWIGLWQPTGQSVVSLGRTGSWRKWLFDTSSDTWKQQPGISGHTQEVRSLAWAPDGSYLISTGSDQTTRLFAEWRREGVTSWHEFARPQIHGYDLNCVDVLSPNRFISGADEKLLRVFDKPNAVARLMTRLCGVSANTNGELPDSASIPVLGLSNKAICANNEDVSEVNGTATLGMEENEGYHQPSLRQNSNFEMDHPPLEEHLSRQTLWPEHEKLYGHGYEISTVAASHCGPLVATACKASSLEHAVIRIYESREWREVKPPLTAHNLTVTSLAFSTDDQYLLSVGRDRQWAIFARESEDSNIFELLKCNPNSHSRMILDCSWAPDPSECVFATAGRDKLVKIWKRTATDNVDCITSIGVDSSVTAIDFRPTMVDGFVRLALATEKGNLQLVDLHAENLEVSGRHDVPAALSPSDAINALRWAPGPFETGSSLHQLAVASNDTSLRIFSISP